MSRKVHQPRRPALVPPFIRFISDVLSKVRQVLLPAPELEGVDSPTRGCGEKGNGAEMVASC